LIYLNLLGRYRQRILVMHARYVPYLGMKLERQFIRALKRWRFHLSFREKLCAAAAYAPRGDVLCTVTKRRLICV